MAKRMIWIASVLLFLGVVFCGGFFYFQHRLKTSPVEAAGSETSKSLINKPFPHAELVDTYGAKVDEQILRTGRVVVVFVSAECDACTSESKFLETVVNRRKDVTFYGVVPFGTHPQNPDAAVRMFPFTVLYDEGNAYVVSMGINRVPVKVFLEDGIIKKGWIGAAVTDQARTSFTEWLEGLP
ncbi:MAG: Redoxin [Acidobacteriota bacterium]|jgi:peroxiredoxin